MYIFENNKYVVHINSYLYLEIRIHILNGWVNNQKYISSIYNLSVKIFWKSNYVRGKLQCGKMMRIVENVEGGDV